MFISHATPEDNEFAIWLASRLEMLGYKTWIDKQHLLGGERMWQEIQTIIEYNAIKILFVYSKNIRDNKTLFHISKTDYMIKFFTSIVIIGLNP